MDTAVTAAGTPDGAPSPAALPEPPDPMVGRLLDGRYRLEAGIARGGMATVYRATDTRLDRVVAVKVMRAALADDPEFVERFTREARAAARLSSPDVVGVYDQGRDAATGTAYLVMEHVPGRTVRDLLHEQGALPAGQALALLEPVLRALAAAHAAGLVHRDVKPENVLVAPDGRVKVADFGLARAVETTTVTATGLLIGTVAYLSPEQVVDGHADPRSDVYAAGIVLWELLTGAPPYSAPSPLSVAYRHVHEDVPPPSTVVEGLPEPVDALVLRATRRDPAARPADAGAFLAELRAVLGDLPADSTDTVVVRRPTAGQPTLVVPVGAAARPTRPVPRRRRRRTGLLWVLVVALLAGAALAGGWYLGSGRYTETPGVLGLDPEAATAQLVAAGLEVVMAPEPVNDEQVAAGLVLDQDPDPSSRALRGATVTLVLSGGPDRRSVPELVGQEVDAARAALEAVGLRLGQETEDFSDQPVGVVISSNPAAGEELRPDTPVAVVVSRGVEQLPVPSVVGRERGEAEQQLEAAGFAGEVREVFSEEVERGVVVAQTPREGQAPRGSAVQLDVSRGPELVAVPDVGGSSREEAEAALVAAGLRPSVTARPGPGGSVRLQEPSAGTQVRKGSTVNVLVF